MLDSIKKVIKKHNLKQDEEIGFWIHELDQYKEWYSGQLSSLYDVPAPTEKQKVVASNVKDSALLTWLKLHQEPKYLQDLRISKSAFKGLKLLDVGAGPFPSARVFQGVKLYCLDQLYAEYLRAGYPIHYYDGVNFINASSEDIPVDDRFFDAVISLNAIDHVDDLHATAKEIRRVLKPNGKFAMHVHYHKATPTEPLEINDKIFLEEFGWVKGLEIKHKSKKKTGSTAEADEQYVLWRNF